MNNNDEADANILVKSENGWIDQEAAVLKDVTSLLGGSKLDAVICVAGGWAGGNAASKDFVKNSELMWKQSVWSSSIAASIAANHLKEGVLRKSVLDCSNLVSFRRIGDAAWGKTSARCYSGHDWIRHGQSRRPSIDQITQPERRRITGAFYRSCFTSSHAGHADESEMDANC